MLTFMQKYFYVNNEFPLALNIVLTVITIALVIAPFWAVYRDSKAKRIIKSVREGFANEYFPKAHTKGIDKFIEGIVIMLIFITINNWMKTL